MTAKLAAGSALLALAATAFVLANPNTYAEVSCGVGGCVESHRSFFDAHGAKSLVLLLIPAGVGVAAFVAVRSAGLPVLAVAAVALAAFVVVSLASVGMFYAPSLALLVLALATRFSRESRSPRIASGRQS